MSEISKIVEIGSDLNYFLLHIGKKYIKNYDWTYFFLQNRLFGAVEAIEKQATYNQMPLLETESDNVTELKRKT